MNDLVLQLENDEDLQLRQTLYEYESALDPGKIYTVFGAKQYVFKSHDGRCAEFLNQKSVRLIIIPKDKRRKAYQGRFVLAEASAPLNAPSEFVFFSDGPVIDKRIKR